MGKKQIIANNKSKTNVYTDGTVLMHHFDYCPIYRCEVILHFAIYCPLDWARDFFSIEDFGLKIDIDCH